MATNEELRLRQAPIDVWSTREKLALATSVQKSGNNNWNSVSRLLKAFGEENRPDDWFNARFCARQYQKMLENTEKTKRKRDKDKIKEQRGEETTQDLIVKKLTNERIDELTIQIKEKLKKFSEKKSLYDKLKSGDFDQKFFAETCAFIRNEQKQKREEKEANEKWLAEREAKILAEKMTRRGPLLKPVRLPTTHASVVDTLNDEETKVKISDDKMIASKNCTPQAGTEPSLGSEKDNNSTTLLSVLSMSNENPKLLRSSDEMVEEKVFEKVESPLAEDIKDDVDKDEYETASDGTVKMDTDETKSSAAEEATVDGGSEHEEVRPNDVKSHVVNELENSNDTIEETVSEQSSIPEAKKDGTHLNFLEPTKPSTSENSRDSFSSASKANESESSPQVANKEHHPEIKVEEDSSISAMDANISNIEGKNNANADNLESPIKRRRGRKSQKISGAPLMQTRSTRSQSHIKMEEPKERVEQIKKRTNSADETSVDNTISEESNDAKSSANDSADVEFDEMWREDAISIWRNIKNLGKAPMFLQPTSEAAESCRKLVRRQMDLNTIRRRIETGQIRNRVEFKRDLMVMFANVYISHSSKHRTYKIAEEMEKDSLKLCEQKHEHKITRAHEKTSLTPDVKTNRRKTRGSISMEGNKPANKKRT